MRNPPGGAKVPSPHSGPLAEQSGCVELAVADWMSLIRCLGELVAAPRGRL
jgi:hypothetical protein